MSERIGVLVSRGYGAGWSTWNQRECAVDQELVQAFLNNLSEDEIMAIAEKNWPKAYKGGLLDCEVVMVDKGQLFRITDYDGYESIEFNDSDFWQVA